jgi:hypothetical protein
MTYDELLARINKVFDEPHIRPDFTPIQAVEALKAVIELHHPWTSSTGVWCRHCEDVFDASISYPCPTIQAIEKELK